MVVNDNVLMSLQWYKLPITFLNVGCSSSEIPVNAFQAIVKGISSAIGVENGDPSVFFQIKEWKLDDRFHEFQTIPVEVLFCGRDSAFIEKWIASLKSYLADSYTGRNFRVLSVGKAEKRHLLRLAGDNETDFDREEIGLEFLTPFPFSKDGPIGNISKDSFLRAFEERLSRLFSREIRYERGDDDFTLTRFSGFRKEPRPSNRKHELIGCTGYLYLRGKFDNFLPFLLLCQELHVVGPGFPASYSRGAYRLFTPDIYYVAYEITQERERVGLGKLLKKFGVRLTPGLFECRLDDRGKADLIAKLEKLGIKTGFIKIYRLEYTSKNAVIGERGKPGIDEGNAFVV